MQDARSFSLEAEELAGKLINDGKLSLRELQQGLEWCERNGESLVVFLERFCAPSQSARKQLKVVSDDPTLRAFARHEARRSLWIEVEERLVEIDTVNISRGGLAFRSRWALARGTTLQFRGEPPIQAIVRYCVKDGEDLAMCGAEFSLKDLSDLRHIEALLQSLGVQPAG